LFDLPQSHSAFIGIPPGGLDIRLVWRSPGQERHFEGWRQTLFVTRIPPKDNCGVRVPPRFEEERRMSTTIEEVVGHRETLLEVEYDVARRDAERAELAREIEAQHERLHKVRATVLEELTKQRRLTLPRWPSGPKLAASLVDEDEWWSKMLGRKRAA
jgi:hypothetical protein